MQPRDFEAAQEFLLAAKQFWSTSMYRSLRNEYDASLKHSGRSRPTTAAGVAETLKVHPTYQYFAWLERHLQKMKYSGSFGLVPYYSERRQEILGFAKAPPVNGRLTLDPKLALPDYYTQVDIHQHPGGLWSDEIAGAVYESGARTTTPLLGDSHASLHDRFTKLIASRGPAQRILDLGCGFGKSTRPFATTFTGARIDAIDLSASCLRFAAANGAPPPAAAIHFQQMDANELKFPASSFDLVTSTMFLHETPPEPLRRVFEETFRVLEPGGRMIHLDFYLMPDVFSRFMHYGHGQRNNEPFMQPLAELDLPGLLSSIGFVECTLEPFSESDGSVANAEWRFPWTVISARKPPA